MNCMIRNGLGRDVMGSYMCSSAVVAGMFGQYTKPKKAFSEVYEESIKRTAAVGSQLRAAREAAGISRKKLAEFIGCGSDYVMDVESGRSIPTVSFIVGFCVCVNKDTPDEMQVFPSELLGIYPKKQETKGGESE